MRTLIRAIKRSTLAIAILAVLATCAVFVPPAHHASAASAPYISFQYNSSTGTDNLVGQGFSPGQTVYLARFSYQYQCYPSLGCHLTWVQQSYDYTTAAQCFVAYVPYVHCTNNVAPGTFTYTLPGNLGLQPCSGDMLRAYDYTYGWSNPVYTSNCIH
jgi:hypothetical protein